MNTSSDETMFYRKTFIGRVIPDESRKDANLPIRVIKTGYCFANTLDLLCEKARDDKFDPITVPSKNWEVWVAVKDGRTCTDCLMKDGTVCAVGEEHHPNCRCERTALRATEAGGATKDGENGADWWLKNRGRLPEYYETMERFKEEGWSNGESPSKYLQGKMMTCGVYGNDDGILPEKLGRIWYEADINYYFGKRNSHRVVWSNDGLVFATYDHYKTFIEIT